MQVPSNRKNRAFAAPQRYIGELASESPSVYLLSRLTVVLARLHCSASAGLWRLVRVNDFRYYSRFEHWHKRSVCENKSRFSSFLRRTVMVQCFVDVWLPRFGDSDENAVRMILPTGKTASNYSPKPKVSSRLPGTNPSVQLNYVLDRSTGPAGSP